MFYCQPGSLHSVGKLLWGGVHLRQDVGEGRGGEQMQGGLCRRQGQGRKDGQVRSDQKLKLFCAHQVLLWNEAKCDVDRLYEGCLPIKQGQARARRSPLSGWVLKQLKWDFFVFWMASHIYAPAECGRDICRSFGGKNFTQKKHVNREISH